MNRSVALSFAALMAAGCGEPAPGAIAYGAVECRHCHMTVTDPRFSAELVTRRRRVLVFDDPGCLAAFVTDGTIPAAEVHSLWVSDYLRPDSLLRVEDAAFVASDSLHTPMNRHLAAVRPGPAADSLAAALDGRVIRWEEVLTTERAGAAHGQ